MTEFILGGFGSRSNSSSKMFISEEFKNFSLLLNQRAGRKYSRCSKPLKMEVHMIWISLATLVCHLIKTLMWETL